MPQLIRIIYISRSTFKPTGSNAGIEPNVGRILIKSRINNRRDGLVGVLYFGDGCFFQCLEGEQSAVENLYARLELDDRHKDMKMLSRENIKALSYSDWAMKFVPLEMQMTRLLKEWGFKRFDPYRFDSTMVRKVMDLLRTSTDSTTDTGVESLIEQSIAATAADKASKAAAARTIAAGLLLFAAGAAVGRFLLP